MKSTIKTMAQFNSIAVIGAACILSASVVRAQVPTHLWSESFGDASYQYGYSVAVDPGGNVYCAGGFMGSINFGAGTLTSLGGYDIFLAKFSPTGAIVWSKRYGDANEQIANAVATDPSGNVYLAGVFGGSVDFGGGPLSAPVSGPDVFLVKLDASGAHQWSKQFGDADTQYSRDVATDPSGNVFLCGDGNGTMDFGGGGLVLEDDIFLAKFDASGAHQWSQKFGDNLEGQLSTSLATDAAGSVYITGQLDGSANFGGSTLTSVGFGDVFLAKFDGAGVHQWSKSFGGAELDVGQGVATDPTGNVYLTGDFAQSINFGGSTLTGDYDVFLAKFNSAGSHQWSKSFGGSNFQGGRDVAATSSGVYLLGYLFDSTDFGGGILTSAGAEDIFLAKFSPSGVYHGCQRYGDVNNQYPGSIAADAAGNAVVTGYFEFVIDFGGPKLFSQGAVDVFLAKFGPAATAVGDLPRSTLTISASPNPFNPSTVVRYLLPHSGNVTIRIFDTHGARVTTLVDGGQSAGEHTVTWEGKDTAGNRASSGVYFARLGFAGETKTLRLVLVK